MTIRFRKRLSIAPGVRLNLGLRGASVSFGVRGIGATFGRKTTVHAGLPGSGLYWTQAMTPHPYVERHVAARWWHLAALGFMLFLLFQHL